MNFFKNKFKLLKILFIFSSLVNFSFADSDGPDCFKVKNVAEKDFLNLREVGDNKSKVLLKIPSNADSIINLGCAKFPANILKIGRDSNFNHPEYISWKNKFYWCKVKYNSIEGFCHGKYLTNGVCK